jgi:hypothetical protein
MQGLPTIYGGLSRGIESGFSMGNMIDRTKMAKESLTADIEDRKQTQLLRSQQLALQKMQEERLKQNADWTKMAANVSTFMSNIKDLDPNAKSQAIKMFQASIPENYPTIKQTLGSIDVANQEQFKVEQKAMNDFNKEIASKNNYTPQALLGFAANNSTTKAGMLAAQLAKTVGSQDKLSGDMQAYTKYLQQGGKLNILQFLQQKTPPKAENYDKNLYIAAQAAGVSPEKVKSGKLTQKEATAIAKTYSEKFGTQSLIELLMKSGVTPQQAGQAGVLKFNDKGEQIQ